MAKDKPQKMMMNLLGTKPIAFNPDLAHALGDIKAGLFLSQMLFWCGKSIDPDWIYKTIEEMEKETGLSVKEQARAIKICKGFGLVETKLMKIPAKRHFKLNIEKIERFLEKYYASLPEEDKQPCEEEPDLISPFG